MTYIKVDAQTIEDSTPKFSFKIVNQQLSLHQPVL